MDNKIIDAIVQKFNGGPVGIKTIASKNKIKIYGSTNYKKKLLKNYINLPFKKELLKSSSKTYVENFLSEEEYQNHVSYLQSENELLNFNDRTCEVKNWLNYLKI